MSLSPEVNEPKPSSATMFLSPSPVTRRQEESVHNHLSIKESIEEFVNKMKN